MFVKLWFVKLFCLSSIFLMVSSLNTTKLTTKTPVTATTATKRPVTTKSTTKPPVTIKTSVTTKAVPTKPPATTKPTPTKPPVTTKTVPTKPPVTTKPIPTKPPVTTKLVPAKPPVTTKSVPAKPPVTRKPVPGKPPVTTKPVSGKPPVTTKPVPAKPPVTTKPVPAKPPVITKAVPAKPPVTTKRVPAKPPVTKSKILPKPLHSVTAKPPTQKTPIKHIPPGVKQPTVQHSRPNDPAHFKHDPMPQKFDVPQFSPPHQNRDGPYSEEFEPWIQQQSTSQNRRILNNCECGKRNGPSGQEGRIINGFNTVNHEYPWQTYIMAIENRQTVIINGVSSVNFDFKSCGGSIINDMYILTAAHCMVDERPGQWRKVKSASDIQGKIMTRNSKDSNAKDINFDMVIVHPGYLAFKPMQQGASVVSNLYDIALLRLTERLPLDWSPFLKPVCLPESNDNINIQEGTQAKLVGWGLTSRGPGASASENLLQLNFGMHNASTCDKYSGGDASRFVCGEDLHSDTGSAQGDSGGPLVIQMGSDPNKLIQIGVVSFTNRGQFTWNGAVTETYSLGYYSSVTSFLPFIDYHSSAAGANWCQRI